MYQWCYFCGDPRKLAITLRYLPEEPFTSLRHMIVAWCSHLDGPKRYAALKQASLVRPPWLHVSFIDLSDAAMMNAAMLLAHPVFKHYWCNSRAGWSLGFKLVAPLVFKNEPTLYTDDDVLVLRDPKYLMDQPFGTSMGMNRLILNPRALRLCEVYGLEDPLCYNDHMVDAAVWYDKTHDTWKQDLLTIWSSDVLASLKPDSTEFRVSDQRYLTSLAYKRKWHRLTSVKDRRFYLQAFPGKLNFDTTFLHYCASSHKRAYMEYLEDEGTRNSRLCR